MNFHRAAMMALPAFMLCACSTGEVMQTQYLRSASPSFFQYGASPGEMLAVVIGNPFPVSKDVVDQAVTDAMYMHTTGPVTRFSTHPGPKAHKNLRIVLAFNPPSTLNNDRLCEDPAAVIPGPTGQRLHMSVGFCVDQSLYTVSEVSIPRVDSPNDPRFRKMVANAMWSLIPTWDPLSHGEDQCWGTGC